MHAPCPPPSAAIRPPEQQETTLAGRRWLHQYVNGCRFTFVEQHVPKRLVGQTFIEVAQWLFATANFVLIGGWVLGLLLCP